MLTLEKYFLFRGSMITIWDLAVHRGMKPDADGSASAEQFGAVGLCIMGGCIRCEATIAAYNACPTRTGYWMCLDCVGEDGFHTPQECEDWMKQQDDLDHASSVHQPIIDF